MGVQESTGSNGRGEAWSWSEDEENGVRNGTGLWNEGSGEEAEAPGFRSRCKFLYCYDCYQILSLRTITFMWNIFVVKPLNWHGFMFITLQILE